MPKSCKCILNRMVYKGAMTEDERDKILRNIKTEWIPVTERLPEEGMNRYLISTKYGDVMTDLFMGDRFTQGNDVTAWMPLPKPYEGSEEE